MSSFVLPHNKSPRYSPALWASAGQLRSGCLLAGRFKA